MWIELPPLWIVVLNVVAIPAIHVAVSWAFTRLPRRLFRPEAFWFRERDWERGGGLYERAFAVRRWKGLLPDAAPWLGGFAKRRLSEKDPGYVRTFRAETCRSEAAHLAQVPALLLTLVWNPWPAAASVVAAYALLSNLPCLVLQRHTRHRLGRFLEGIERRGG